MELGMDRHFGPRCKKCGTEDPIYFVRILKIYSWDREKRFSLYISDSAYFCDSSTQGKRLEIEFKSRK